MAEYDEYEGDGRQSRAVHDAMVMDRMSEAIEQGDSMFPKKPSAWVDIPPPKQTRRGSTSSRRGSTSGRRSTLQPTLPIAKRSTAGMRGEAMFLAKRMDVPTVGICMGHASRSFITGRISLKELPAFPDFCLVDLWDRDTLEGPLSEIVADKYLFKPVPLKYRTWMYHYNYVNKRFLGQSDHTSEILDVLSDKCIDESVGAGRWSPIICYAPLALGACLTEDQIFVMTAAFSLVLLYFVAWNWNTPPGYKYSRIITLPVRLVLIIYFFMRIRPKEPPVAIIGIVVGLVCILVDVIAGDIGMGIGYRYQCSYDVLRTLPEGVLVCRRIGANFSKGSRTQDTPLVDDSISGLFPWLTSHHIIAEIQGLIVELHPLSKREWLVLQHKYSVTEVPLTFASTGTFNEERPTVAECDEDTRYEVLSREMAAKLKNVASPLNGGMIMADM
mmetsp:Transcript_1056/g.3020  ORF Transcript_1056/g.3020 Transcript_1056/m.3020 type:complete len:443 (-) Transcript_1056:107-1435(-)